MEKTVTENLPPAGDTSGEANQPPPSRQAQNPADQTGKDNSQHDEGSVNDGSMVNHINKEPPLRWLAFLGLIVVGALYTTLSSQVTFGPSWLLLAAEVVLVVIMFVSERQGIHKVHRKLARAALLIVTILLGISIALMVMSLPDHKYGAPALLRDAAILWLSNILIFTLWYSFIDGGGPLHRHGNPNYRDEADFYFPQLMPGCPRVASPQQWWPNLSDYLFIAFNTSTAFSPTDTPVLSTSAKLLSMLQAVFSLITLATLAARAINIL